MITVDVTGVESLQRDIERAGKQLPFALALALTRTAEMVKLEESKEMQRVFRSPTPYTLDALYLKRATKTRLEAEVWVKDASAKGTPATKYLLPQVYGGERNTKRFESLMRDRDYMTASEYVVPAEGAQLDAYGNLSRGQLSKILAQLQAAFDPLQRETPTSRKRSLRRTRGGRYFIGGAPGRGQHLARGVWERLTTGFGSGVRPVLLFVRQPRYVPRFKFFEVAQRVVNDQLPYQAKLAVEHALKTARFVDTTR